MVVEVAVVLPPIPWKLKFDAVAPPNKLRRGAVTATISLNEGFGIPANGSLVLFSRRTSVAACILFDVVVEGV